MRKSNYLNGTAFICVWDCPLCNHHNKWYLSRSREKYYTENSTHKLECEWCDKVSNMVKKEGKLVKLL